MQWHNAASHQGYTDCIQEFRRKMKDNWKIISDFPKKPGGTHPIDNR